MKKSFGECLDFLLELFKINGSKLAKGINIDQSLVYKWIHNKRIPAYHSPYIELIADYLTANIENPYHTKNISEFLLRGRSDELNGFNMRLEIRNMLYEAQSYSLEQKRDLLKKEQEICLENQEGLFMSNETVKVVKGIKNVLNCAIRLLTTAPAKPDKDNTVYLNFNSNQFSTGYCNDFIVRWKNALIKILDKGWKVVLLIELNDSVKRTLRVIEALHFTFDFNQFDIYYHKKESDIAGGTALVIVPHTGALFCFNSYVQNRLDSGFLFESEDCLKALQGHFYQLLTRVKPLFKEYPCQISFEYQKLLVETEEQFGDRFVYNGGQTATALPYVLYEKYLHKRLNNKSEILQYAYLHKKRLDAFNTQIKIFKFRDIWFKESIEQIVFERKYSCGQNCDSADWALEKEDIILHIENIIHLLQKHHNYEVAIINQCEAHCKVRWTVKSTSYVLIEGDKNHPDIRLVITEENFVSAYRELFLKIWDDISNVNKDKERIIEWLKSLLNAVV